MTGNGIEVLGVLITGVGAAALIYAALHALRTFGITLPRWFLPAGIGLSMIGYSVWNDYAWFGRAEARLPPSSQIVLTGRTSFPWAPWTYLSPVVVRFAAIDPARITDQSDGTRRAEIMLVERRGQTLIVPQEFDCAGRAVRPARGDWTPVAPDDPAFAVICPAKVPG